MQLWLMLHAAPSLKKSCCCCGTHSMSPSIGTEAARAPAWQVAKTDAVELKSSLSLFTLLGGCVVIEIAKRMML